MESKNRLLKVMTNFTILSTLFVLVNLSNKPTFGVIEAMIETISYMLFLTGFYILIFGQGNDNNGNSLFSYEVKAMSAVYTPIFLIFWIVVYYKDWSYINMVIIFIPLIAIGVGMYIYGIKKGIIRKDEIEKILEEKTKSKDQDV